MSKVDSPPVVQTFSEKAFLDWYKSMETQLWMPAEVTIRRLLNELLDRELSDFTRRRIQVTSSRVKDAARTWKKMQKEKYRGKITLLDDIPMIIDDLVGVRVTCNNLSDVEYLVSTLGGLPDAEENPNAPLSVFQERDSDYVTAPKPSGYRAYHVNLSVQVPSLTEMYAVPVELQIRTLLQDSWGELTHEDTYKPEMELPALIEPLALRMADLLAVVDHIAQDIRDELDRKMNDLGVALSDDGVARAPTLTTPGEIDVSPHDDDSAEHPRPGVAPEVMAQELRRMISGLTKPASMAELAQSLISLFGPDVADGWAGHGGFKHFLSWAVPDAIVTNVGPSYVAPAGLPIPDQYTRPVQREQGESSTPEVVLQLKKIDSNMPTCSGPALGKLLLALQDALSPATWARLGIYEEPRVLRIVNLLSKDARDRSVEDGGVVSRPNLDWALKALLWSGNLHAGLAGSVLIEVLVSWILSRAASQGIPVDPVATADEVRAWLEDGLSISS